MLNKNDPKEKREEYKNQAVETRESGKLQESIKMLEEVIKWDNENNNPRGKLDALGHIKIAYTRLAEEITSPDQKFDYYTRIVQLTDEGEKICSENPEIPEGPRVIHKVHAASTKLSYNEYLTNEKDKKENLEEALILVNEAMSRLPGSKAHLAWPANTKAKILYELGRKSDAVQTLNQAQTWLYEGYEDEINNDDQAELKLKVWLSGITLTLANIYSKENMPILARQYATSVVQIEDPSGTINERKKEAQRILDSLEI